MKGIRAITDAVMALLRQGITPERIAASLSLGFIIGVIPVLGLSTILCTVLALPLRLNLVAIQAMNWVVYPLQLMLLIPMYRAGEWLFDAPRLGLLPAEIVALFQQGLVPALNALWDTTLHALAVWGLASLVVAPLLYFALLPLLRQALRRRMAQFS